MNWFEQLTGFRETSGEAVRSQLELDGLQLRSRVNGRAYQCGTLEILSLAELRERTRLSKALRRSLKVQEVVGDVQDLHCDPANAGALFQVASQFNLLEMISPNVTPEDGVSIYESDRTQGPACAIGMRRGNNLPKLLCSCWQPDWTKCRMPNRLSGRHGKGLRER